MPQSRQGTAEVHEVHHAPAEQVAEGVGIVRQREFRILRNGLADGPAFKAAHEAGNLRAKAADWRASAALSGAGVRLPVASRVYQVPNSTGVQSFSRT